MIDAAAPKSTTNEPPPSTTVERPPLAWLPVGIIAAAVTTALLVSARGYDYHRDELYFRVLGLHPAWGYVDQPPFSPLLSRLGIEIFGDSVWAMRVPDALIIGAAAVLIAFVTREVGGGRGAQTLAALGMATAFPLIGGHVVTTATPDIIFWLLVILFAMRALLRDRPRYWLAVGLTSGLALYNKHLVILLLVTLGAALLLVGPRRVLASPWLWAGMAIAVVVGSPNLIYQITHDFPQLKMAEALSENKGDDARVTMLPLQVVMLGVPYTPIWIAGIVTLFRDRRLRPVRALAVAYLLIVVVLLVIAGQPYYSMGLLLAVYAIGCAPTARWLAGHRWRQALMALGVVFNVATSALIALPIVPVDRLGGTAIPEINQVTRDQIGWPTYVKQIADVYAALPAEDKARAVIYTGNYGEYGAVDRYGKPYGLPKVYSGQNELYYLGHPPDSATVVVFVLEDPDLARLGQGFDSCSVNGKLHNGIGVDNEEESALVVVCRGPRLPWAQLWPRFQHYD